MDDAMTDLDSRRLDVSRRVDRARRSALGQFFTPSPVARFMASLLAVPRRREFSLLDPGAGIGSLAAAVLDRTQAHRVKLTCYEIEPKFEHALRETLTAYPQASLSLHGRDFIEDAVRLVSAGNSPLFDMAILNPPYKKIGVASSHRLLVRKLGIETSNLYTCFLACAVALCRPLAQVVAIIPRSFMNGVYFKPFRYWLLGHAALTHIHVFGSRDSAFADDDVLQENVIVRLVVGGEQSDVVVSTSHDQSFSDMRERVYPFDTIVTVGDDEQFIHAPATASGAADLTGVPLNALGLDVCTGPVVDFRLREHLRPWPEAGSVPLLYSTHVVGGELEWPKQGRKPNAIMRNSATERWLMPNGCYVLTRRFSSKEEKRRVVAYVLDDRVLPTDVVGFENHLNVFHCGKHGLPRDLARGLAAYLNSQVVDDYFRTFSGHTQVNATDLRRLKYPSVEDLANLGTRS